MWRRFRPPLALVAAALLGLIALLAVLQYRWLGQISDAERTQRRTTLAAGALEFAQDFDREITRAYLLFQADTPIEHMANDQELAGRFAARYDRWQATARFPRLVNEFYSFSQDHRDAGGARSRVGDLRRFDPATRRLEPAEWPASMKDWRDQLAVATWQDSSSSPNALFIRKIPSAIWESAPAIVVPTPVIVLGEPKPGPRMAAEMSYSLLAIDREYVARELLPSLATRYFGHATGTGDAGAGLDFKVAVLSTTAPNAVVFQSPPILHPDSRRTGRRHRRSLSGSDAGLSVARRRGSPLHGVCRAARTVGRWNRSRRRHGDDRDSADVNSDYAWSRNRFSRRWPGTKNDYED